MTELIRSILLNAAFWGGTSRLAAGRTTRSGIDRLFTTAVAGFSVVVVSLELLGLAHQINSVSVAGVCLATGLLGVMRRRASAVDGPRSEIAYRLPALSLLAMGLTAWTALIPLLVGLIAP